jgi:hypothetical protein
MEFLGLIDRPRIIRTLWETNGVTDIELGIENVEVDDVAGGEGGVRSKICEVGARAVFSTAFIGSRTVRAISRAMMNEYCRWFR